MRNDKPGAVQPRGTQKMEKKPNAAAAFGEVIFPRARNTREGGSSPARIANTRMGSRCPRRAHDVRRNHALIAMSWGPTPSVSIA